MYLAILLFSVAVFASERRLAPLSVAEDPSLRVEGEYLVLLRQGLPSSYVESQVANMHALLAASNDGSEVLHTYSIGQNFNALHLKLSSNTLLKIRSLPEVDLIEENQVVSLSADLSEACHVQNDVIWNLARIDTHDLNLVDDHYSFGSTGAHVDVYIVDTGIQTTHVEFGKRAIWGANFVNDGRDTDCNGHGTHVAGTVAGQLHGVAKGATVIAVKVLGCSGSGTWDGVISGIQYVANEAQRHGRPSVANMSLGGAKLVTVNNAVAAAVDSGVTFAVAAGNENTNACTRSPASEPKAISVAATTVNGAPGGEEKDSRASFSNYGTCVDIAAPGQLIKAAWIDRAGQPPDQVYNTISGTSMASPHVAGVAALVLENHPRFTPVQVQAALEEVATNGVIDMGCSATNTICQSTPNKLIYTNC